MSERRDKSRMLKSGVSKPAVSKEIYKEELGGIDQTLLEKRLEGLRDTQESVQGLSLWCQANKRHSSAIIETWLKILKKSPVEKRLTLFYLANDVIQHAKRKNDATVVNQWAFAVQKATPQVRTPSSVSSAIARIFKIWEERSVYSKETIADLLALLNNVPAKERVGEKKKPETYTASAEKVAAFTATTLISKVKLAYKLKSHLGVTFRAKPFVHMDIENLKGSIKDRSHGMEVIQEIGQLVEQLKASESKLSIEVEERRKIVETAEIAIVHYENVRGEAKIVNSAYKNFTERVESTRDKVIERFKSFEEMEIDSSPVPSPPPEAPSPPPDDDDFGVMTSNNIRHDIMNALNKSNTPQNHSQQQGSYSSNQTIANPNNANAHQYDPQSIPSLAAMQQTFQQNWGAVMPSDNFVGMIQQMLPTANNYLTMQQQQQQQQSFPPLPTPPHHHGYPQQPNTNAASSSSSPYHPHHHPPTTGGGADVSSIPLPPPSEIPLPPPPHQHHMNNLSPPPLGPNNPYSLAAVNPTPANPYSYDTGGGDVGGGSEYVPLPFYKPTQELNSSNLSYGSTEFNSSSSYNSTTPATPNNQSRYHPYHHHHHHNSMNETSPPSHNNNNTNSSSSSSLVSPDYSGGSVGNYNSAVNMAPGGSGNNSINSNLSSPAAAAAMGRGGGDNGGFDPMEMFASALSKNKSTSSVNSQEFQDAVAAVAAFNPTDSFYSPSGFDSFDVLNTNGGGSEVEPYTPTKPGMGNSFGLHRGGGGGRGLLSTPRGNFLNSRPPRGHRGMMRGGPRGFPPNFRGRGGIPRGGGRGNF